MKVFKYFIMIGRKIILILNELGLSARKISFLKKG